MAGAWLRKDTKRTKEHGGEENQETVVVMTPRARFPALGVCGCTLPGTEDVPGFQCCSAKSTVRARKEKGPAGRKQQGRCLSAGSLEKKSHVPVCLLPGWKSCS